MEARPLCVGGSITGIVRSFSAKVIVCFFAHLLRGRSRPARHNWRAAMKSAMRKGGARTEAGAGYN
jgi:hypothetical protein